MADQLFDAYDPAFVRDPYPTYERLRETAPAFFDETWGLTFFTRHSDVSAILRDKRFGRDIRHVIPLDEVDQRTYPTHLPRWYRLIRGSFIDLEPPEHTRLRGTVARSFTRRRAEIRRDQIDAIVANVLSRVRDKDSMEVITDLATPVPLAVIAELMGIAEPDRAQLIDWSHAIVRVFDLNVTTEEEGAAEEATAAFEEYLLTVIARRRVDPGDDLISELANDPGGLDDEDLVATCILALNAGHEATVHGIGNAVLALARHPDQLQRMASEPELGPTAVEELLRFDTPLQMFERWVLEDLDWKGTALKRGDKVGLLFGSANRDPEAFEDPESLDLARADNPHVSFGAGTHFCMGAPLARVELESTLVQLAGAHPELALLEPEPSRDPSLIFRGVRELKVKL